MPCFYTNIRYCLPSICYLLSTVPNALHFSHLVTFPLTKWGGFHQPPFTGRGAEEESSCQVTRQPPSSGSFLNLQNVYMDPQEGLTVTFHVLPGCQFVGPRLPLSHHRKGNSLIAFSGNAYFLKTSSRLTFVGYSPSLWP